MSEPLARPTRTVKESQHETSEIMMPGQANNLGHVFGGVVLALSIAFGLGGRDLAHDFLERRVKRPDAYSERHPFSHL